MADPYGSNAKSMSRLEAAEQAAYSNKKPTKKAAPVTPKVVKPKGNTHLTAPKIS